MILIRQLPSCSRSLQYRWHPPGGFSAFSAFVTFPSGFN